MRRPQEDHADLGLIPDSDHTEDLRTAPVNPGVPAPGEGRRSQSDPEDREAIAMISHDNDVDQDREQELLDQRLAHIAVPAGATTDGWFSIRASDGDAIRLLEWSRHDADKAGIDVGGWQDEHGEVEKRIGLYDVSTEMSAAEARQFASKLIEAADALESLA